MHRYRHNRSQNNFALFTYSNPIDVGTDFLLFIDFSTPPALMCAPEVQYNMSFIDLSSLEVLPKNYLAVITQRCEFEETDFHTSEESFENKKLS